MKAFLILTGTGPVLVLSQFGSVKDPALLGRLKAYGKFIAFDVPLEMVQGSYSAHLPHVLDDPKQTDEFRVLDSDGKQIFKNVDLTRLGSSVVYDPEGQAAVSKTI